MHEWVAWGELQANESAASPMPTAPRMPLSTAPISTTTPTAPVSQVQIPSISGNPVTPSVMTVHYLPQWHLPDLPPWHLLHQVPFLRE